MAGLVLILDHQRGAAIILVDGSAAGCGFRIKAPRSHLGFHATARPHVVHDRPVCAAVYASLPPGCYTIHEPAWASGARIAVRAGEVTYADLRPHS